MSRTLSLTSDLVALVDRIVQELGSESRLKPLADDAYQLGLSVQYGMPKPYRQRAGRGVELLAPRTPEQP